MIERIERKKKSIFLVLNEAAGAAGMHRFRKGKCDGTGCSGNRVLQLNMPKLAPLHGFFRAVFARNVSYLPQHLLPGGLGPTCSSHGYFTIQELSKALNFQRQFR